MSESRKKGHKMTLLEAKQIIAGESNKEIFEKQESNNNIRVYNDKEQVKIPAVYIEKSREERLKDQNELLQRFQKLLSMAPKMTSDDF